MGLELTRYYLYHLKLIEWKLRATKNDRLRNSYYNFILVVFKLDSSLTCSNYVQELEKGFIWWWSIERIVSEAGGYDGEDADK